MPIYTIMNRDLNLLRSLRFKFWFPYGIRLVFLVGIVTLAGCASSTDNPHDDWVMMSEDAEKSLGGSYAEELEQQVGTYDSDTYARYVDNVGSRIAVHSERPDLDYQFGILDIFQINALALPGGYIYLTRGLLDELDSEAEMAGVLAHEIAHVAAYHAIKRQQWSAITMLSAAAVASQTGGRGLGESLMAQRMFLRSYTRDAEDQADQLGLRYAALSGYDPKGLIDFLQTLQDIQKEIPQRDILFMRTHPFLTDRVRRARNDLPEYRDLVGDTPIVERARYERHKRRFLYKPREEEFLSTFERYFDAYRDQDSRTMKKLMSDDFRLGDDSSSETTADFMQDINRRIRTSQKIEYDKQLMKMDVGDTDAVVIYEYTSKRWQHDKEKPTINDGFQEMVWRREDDLWRLTRLR